MDGATIGDARWIGTPLSNRNVGASLCVALIPALVTVTQPLLLGGLSSSGLLTRAQIGQAATLELTAMAIVAMLLTMWFEPSRLRATIIVAVGVAAASNLATPYLLPPWLLLARVCSGCASGVFMWQLFALFARSRLPARLNGIYLAIQGVAGLLISAVLANVVLPATGVTTAYLLIAILCLGFGALGWFLPVAYSPLAEDGATPRPPWRGGVALFSMFISTAGILAAWVYLPALVDQLGYPDWVVGVGIPLAVASQIAGGGIAAVLAARLSHHIPIILGGVVFLLIVMASTVAPSALMETALLGLFGFFWMFVGPFYFGYAASIDPARRTIVYVGPAQMLGSGLGPLLGSVWVGSADVRGAMYVAAGLFALGLIAYGASHVNMSAATMRKV